MTAIMVWHIRSKYTAVGEFFTEEWEAIGMRIGGIGEEGGESGGKDIEDRRERKEID